MNTTSISSGFEVGIWFDFYGTVVEINSVSSSLLDWLARDFSYFKRSSRGDGIDFIKITAHQRHYPQADLPELRSSTIGPRCSTYQGGDWRWVNYYNRQAISRWNFALETGEVWSDDVDLLYEICYLLILSRSGELLDRRGIHRLHASAVAIEGQAALIVMSSGGGKTTLSVGAMRIPGAQFLSDDMPLITRKGQVLAFPSRLGLVDLPTDQNFFQFARRVDRREHGPKWLVDADIFQSRIIPEARPRLLIFGVRKLNGAFAIRPVSKLHALRVLASSLIIGVGLPQLIEYFLRLDWRDVIAKTWLIVSRSYCALMLVIKTRSFEVELGADEAANIRGFNDFLKAELMGGAPSGMDSDNA